MIQPGLVYVIEWNCGWVNPNGEGNSSGAGAAEKQAEEAAVVVNEADDPDEAGLNERDKRRLRREEAKREKDKKAKGRTNGKMRGKSKEPSPEAEEDLTEEEGEEDDTKPKEHGAVYVAYVFFLPHLRWRNEPSFVVIMIGSTFPQSVTSLVPIRVFLTSSNDPPAPTRMKKYPLHSHLRSPNLNPKPLPNLRERQNPPYPLQKYHQ